MILLYFPSMIAPNWGLYLLLLNFLRRPLAWRLTRLNSVSVEMYCFSKRQSKCGDWYGKLVIDHRLPLYGNPRVQSSARGSCNWRILVNFADGELSLYDSLFFFFPTVLPNLPIYILWNLLQYWSRIDNRSEILMPSALLLFLGINKSKRCKVSSHRNSGICYFSCISIRLITNLF